MKFIATALLTLATAFASAASAQEPPDRVGRLAWTEGEVSVYQDPEFGWDKAFINLPITSENSVWTDSRARAEVRVGGAALRLDELTQLDIARLDSDQIDAHVERGTVSVRVRFKQPDERLAFSTPQARFLLDADGSYRIDVDAERDESRLTVFSGAAHMESQRGAVRIEPGKRIVVWGSASPSFAFERAAADAFDRWASARDEQWSAPRATRYVSTSMTGYEDLDRYGDWVNEPDYGSLWFPTRVSSDWAPYRHGHWAWVRPWGWSWVDDAPWGYAPFHYGRWVQVRDRWAWSPGRRVDRPTWAPALVAFVGGSNWNVGVSSGRTAPVVGWYPLSPWERYQPWYRANNAYTNRVNIVVNDRPPRQIESRGDWRNWNRDRGTTVVQRDTLVNRGAVANALVSVRPDVARAQAVVPQAQVQQVLPQRNEIARNRASAPGQAAAPLSSAPRQPTVGGAPAGSPAASAEGRPDFSRRSRPAPAPAAANQAPPSAQPAPQQGGAANPLASPRGDEARRMQEAQRQQQLQQQQQQQQQGQQADRATREAQTRERTQRAIEDAQKQQQERTAREAQQQQQQQLQERATRDAQQQQQQQQERAARDTQQRDAQQRAAAREAQQQQERAAREAQQQQQQERASREAQQREAQQRAAREAQQQQERAARESQQQQQAAQRAAREAQQQQERAAREAQPQDRAAREAQTRERTQRAIEDAQKQQQERARSAPADKDKDKKDKEDKDKEAKDKR